MNKSVAGIPAWLSQALPALLALVVLTNIIWAAWLCDDAFISYRSVRNFVEGNGLTFNPAERVQSFTHPLWVLLLIPIYAITGEFIYTAMFVGILISGLAIFQLLRSTTHLRWDAVLVLLALFSSHAFNDYATSGLENPLSHLLIAMFLREWLRGRRAQYLALWAALTMLNRLDLALLFALPLAMTLWQNRNWRTVRQMAIGFLPLIIWELFSLIYYGFLFPNTAYAKLSTGIPSGELFLQGWHYLLFTIENDPVTMLVILAGFSSGMLRRETRWLAIGIGLRLLYTLKVGGDFMGGRFLTTEFFLGLGLLAWWMRERWQARNWIGPSVGAGLLLLALVVRPPALLQPLPWSKAVPEVINARGVADERAFYGPETALLNRLTGRGSELSFRWEQIGRDVQASGAKVSLQYNMGFVGWGAGPENHLVDHFGLTDPLLARLPMLYDPAWRIGHFVRVVPEGYLESLEKDEFLIRDPRLNEYYQRIQTVTRGRIFSWTRFKEIIRFNLGWNAHLVDSKSYRFPVEHRLQLADIDEAGEQTVSLNNFHGLEIKLGGVAVPRFALSGGCCGEYQTVFFAGDEVVFAKAFRVEEETCPDGTCIIEAGIEVADRVVIYPLSASGDFPVRQFQVLN